MSGTNAQECLVDSLAVIDGGPETHFDPAHGLPLAMTYAIGFLHTSDGGHRWMPVRSFLADSTRNCRAMQSPRGGDFTIPDDSETAYSGPVNSGRRGDTWGIWQPDGAPMLTFEDRSIRLVEPGLLDLGGERVGEGSQWRVQHSDHPMVYTSRGFRVRGQIHGHEVEGAYLIDSIHMPAGKSFYPSPYLDRYQVAWLGYVNELADGTWESGTLIAGFDGFQAAVAQHDGKAVAATGALAAKFQIDSHDTAYPARAEISTAEETFVWEADANGRWPVMTHLAEGHRFRLGTLKRAGSTVPIRRSFSYFEGYLPRISRFPSE